jgi:hypothetical protein
MKTTAKPANANPGLTPPDSNNPFLKYQYRTPSPGTPAARELARRTLTRTTKLYRVIPLEHRMTARGLDPVCESCPRLTTRGGSCPGAAGNYAARNRCYPDCHSRRIEYSRQQMMQS